MEVERVMLTKGVQDASRPSKRYNVCGSKEVFDANGVSAL